MILEKVIKDVIENASIILDPSKLFTICEDVNFSKDVEGDVAKRYINAINKITNICVKLTQSNPTMSHVTILNIAKAFSYEDIKSDEACRDTVMEMLYRTELNWEYRNGVFSFHLNTGLSFETSKEINEKKNPPLGFLRAMSRPRSLGADEAPNELSSMSIVNIGDDYYALGHKEASSPALYRPLLADINRSQRNTDQDKQLKDIIFNTITKGVDKLSLGDTSAIASHLSEEDTEGLLTMLLHEGLRNTGVGDLVPEASVAMVPLNEGSTYRFFIATLSNRSVELELATF